MVGERKSVKRDQTETETVASFIHFVPCHTRGWALHFVTCDFPKYAYNKKYLKYVSNMYLKKIYLE